MPTITGLDPAPSGGFSGNELIAVDLETGQTVHATLNDLAALVVVPPIADLPIQSGGLQATDLIAVDHGDGTSYQYTLQDVADFTGGGGSTNLSTNVSSTTVTVLSDTGTDATLVAANGTDAGVMTAAMQVKLAGIATGATANSSDATLLARANHTGTQLASTISDFSEAVDDRVAALLVEGQGIDFAYVDGSNTLTVSITPPSSLPIHSGGLSGLEQVAVDNGSGTIIQVTAQEIANLAPGSGQASVQFQDEGSNLGTSGTATVVNFVGAGVTATRVSNTVTVTVAGGGGTAGRHSIPILAGAMRPSATGGCATLATIASAANQPDIQTLDFDATTQEYAQFSIPMPKSWNEGTVTFVPIWSHAATTTNFGVVWDLQAVAVSNDDAIAVAFGTAQTSTDTGGTTNDVYFGPESSAITVAGTPAAEDVVFFRLSRVTGNGSDTMAIDARLHGIVLYITTDAENDA